MPSRREAVPGGKARDPHGAIERFLGSSRQPVALEPGEDPFPIETGTFAVDRRNGQVIFQVWDQKRNLVRRISGIREERPGRLELLVAKFGNRIGSLVLFDAAHPSQTTQKLRGKRLSFGERFRRLLSLQFPDWKIAELSADADLEHSLSPVYPRALLRRGRSSQAALACPAAAGQASGALSFGLIWLDYLRRRDRDRPVEGLTLFLPQGMERAACLRMRFLNCDSAAFGAFVYSPEGHARRLDLRDYGNLDTRLEPCRTGAQISSTVQGWVERLCRLPNVERITNPDGSTALRVRGVSFARASANELLFGIGRMTPAREHNIAEIEAIAAGLARIRAPQGGGRENPLYRQRPEAWLESQVRAHLEEIDASLLGEPLYGQVPAFAGGDRSVLDLLAADRSGRLAVIELKASEDVHLPLQALDYWMRVKWHLDHGEFSSKGYFRGIKLSPEPPRLLLVAPSLNFHPTTEAILRYFSPDVPVERIGLAVEWRRTVKVMFRIGGAERPA